ncbi:MAG: ATP-binding protein [Bacteroidetes bacterium]|nr:MAG: ATP-binding protein [Bacteroidota bacterium]REK00674.1 MAG: ATP-binding protein [Bacteroidota bacterium]REK35204.1 MAG: ATP-binding protein [Bacteroidota bacterium]REK48281.1 MAG: ATP-binding protein [Bacteroidota bacterium]
MKSIYLIRGLPGSGKSTLANELSEDGLYPVFSVDEYFTNPQTGNYEFNYSRNHLAYKACQENALLAMRQGVRKILIDNTFTLEWEMEPYIKIAKENGYRVFVLTVENRHEGQNIHGVTDEQMKKMAEKFKVKLLP